MANIYEEFEDPEFEMTPEVYEAYRKQRKNAKIDLARRHITNEVGEVPEPTPEALELRERYSNDWEAMHMEVFTNSTGIKPFGTVQKESIARTKHIIEHGGKAVIVEPRGYGKTSRTANNALMAVLQGKAKYVVILASSVTKANDILESILTELQGNDKLAQLYPAICECFYHAGDNAIRAKRQTFRGEPTFLNVSKHMIRLPTIEGEISSGSVIQVRPKDNLRGMHVKIRYGPERGRVLRPDFVFMDDIQTDEEANSPTSVYKIVQTIKKSILFSGSHSKRVSAVMCATPICPGDVVAHFILNEPAWEYVETRMITKMPDNLNMWLDEYSRILLGFDRTVTGDRTRARLRAREYVEKNYEKLHAGAEVSWEWAYGWAEDPQTEVSTLQHAINFLIEEGQEAFDSECQCTVSARMEETLGIKATVDEIVNKVHSYPRLWCPVETEFIATHIDVNKHILTWATVASPRDFRPHVIDYGTFPEQKGMQWKKKDLVYTLHRQYPEAVELDELVYVAVKDLINQIGDTVYYREDGQEITNNLILVDTGWKIESVKQAIRDSRYKHISVGCKGQGIAAKDKPFMDRNYSRGSQKHFHCATIPSYDRITSIVYMDTHFFKTLFHKGIQTRLGIASSASLYTPERVSEHLMLAKHCTVEPAIEDRNEKEQRTVVVWNNEKEDDTEFFDNIIGGMAGLFKLGCEIRSRHRKRGTYNIQDYVEKQGGPE